MIQRVFFNHNNQLIAGKIHIPSGKGPFASFVFVHGLAKKGKDFKPLIKACNYLCKQGYACFRFDFQGFGESKGDLSSITVSEQVKVLDTAHKFFMKQDYIDKNNIAFVGLSLGALISIVHALSIGIKGIKSLVLISPVTNPQNLVKRILKKKSFKNGFIKLGPLIFGFKLRKKSFDDLNSYEADSLYNIKVPTLIIHGVLDKIVPIADSKEYFKRLKCRKKLIEIPGGNHYLTSKENRQRVLSESLSWFKKFKK